MTEIQLIIDDSTVDKLLANLPRRINLTDYIVDAITFYNWVINELCHNRIVWSCNPDTTDIRQISTPILDKIRSKND